MSSQSEKEGRPHRIASQEFLPRANKVSFELQILFSNKNETKNTKRDSINSLLFQFIININTQFLEKYVSQSSFVRLTLKAFVL
jgi:hypothetical protein